MADDSAPGGLAHEIAIRSVRALRSCVLDDERSGMIGPEYRQVLEDLRVDVDRILAVGVDPAADPCGRCGGQLGAGEVGWHALCPGGTS